MLRSLYAGISGITGQQAFMDVISNNIANVNTTGYKAGRITFADTLSETIADARGSLGNFGGVNPIQIGLGTKINSIDTNFKQGSMEATGMTTDLAINGNDFFIVSDGSNRYFTRSGAFQVDNNGYLLGPGGSTFVQGRMADEDGQLTSSTAVENIQLPFGKKDPAKATENVSLYCNLDQTAAKFEEWLGERKLETKDGTDISTSTSLANIEGFEIVDGDTIEINGTDRDGAALTGNFTYGLANDGITLGELLATINTTFSSGTDDGASIKLDENGFLRFKANQAGENDFSIAIVPPDTVDAVYETHTTSAVFQTSGVATQATDDLTNIDGVGGTGGGGELVAGDTFTISGTNAAGAVVNATFTYGAANDGTTMQDLVSFISSQFAGSTASLDTNGNIVLTDDSPGVSATTFAITDGTGTGFTRATSAVEGRDTTNVIIPSFAQEVVGATGKHTTTITVYDSQGDTHELEFEFLQDPTPGSNLWTWSISIDEGDIVPTEGSTGTVEFNADGSMKEFAYDNNAEALRFSSTGIKEMVIDFNAGTSGGFDGITQFSSASTTIAIEQDGYSLGVLDSISVDDQGIVNGFYSNGQSRTLAQIALANFTNRGGLKKEGSSLFSANTASGNPIISWAGSNTSSQIQAGYLESSNVDLTNELSQMIIAQRGIQANSKVISTSDTILTTIIDRMKR